LVLMTLILVSTPARAVDQEDIDKAIERGVQALRQMQHRDGTWPYTQTGATSLAALTLLECGAGPDDEAVSKAADVIRAMSPYIGETYSIALAIMFLDRLGDVRDLPLLESLTVRLLAGQMAEGGWGYQCPPVSEQEVARLTAHVKNRNELK